MLRVFHITCGRCKTGTKNYLTFIPVGGERGGGAALGEDVEEAAPVGPVILGADAAH